MRDSVASPGIDSCYWAYYFHIDFMLILLYVATVYSDVTISWSM